MSVAGEQVFMRLRKILKDPFLNDPIWEPDSPAAFRDFLAVVAAVRIPFQFVYSIF